MNPDSLDSDNLTSAADNTIQGRDTVTLLNGQQVNLRSLAHVTELYGACNLPAPHSTSFGTPWPPEGRRVQLAPVMEHLRCRRNFVELDLDTIEARMSQWLLDEYRSRQNETAQRAILEGLANSMHGVTASASVTVPTGPSIASTRVTCRADPGLEYEEGGDGPLIRRRPGM